MEFTAVDAMEDDELLVGSNEQGGGNFKEQLEDYYL